MIYIICYIVFGCIFTFLGYKIMDKKYPELFEDSLKYKSLCIFLYSFFVIFWMPILIVIIPSVIVNNKICRKIIFFNKI